jgi:hypothetical protein
MTRVSHASKALAATVLTAWVCDAASAHDLIGVHLRPTSSTVSVGDTVGVQIYAVREPNGGSFNGLGELFSVVDLFFSWNPQDLRLMGLSSVGGPPNAMFSGFPVGHYTGVNEAVPPADGTGFYSLQLLPPYPAATPSGTLVATLNFQVLRAFATTEVTPLVYVPVPGSATLEFTKVVYGPGYITTGTLGSAIVVQGNANPCPADLNGDGAVESYDLGAVLAAWGAVNSPANLVLDNGSPTVDGADLAFLLAAWGPCGN